MTSGGVRPVTVPDRLAYIVHLLNLNFIYFRDADTMPEPSVTDQGFRFTAGGLRQRLRDHTGRIKDMIRQDIQGVPGLMALLMKPRNGSRWTRAERSELAGQLRGLSRLGLVLALTLVPGTVIVLPLLAWWLDRRRSQSPRVAGRRANDLAQDKDIKVERAETDQRR